MNIKAVFFDIDDTFYDHRSGQVLPETLQAVQLLHEHGYKVALCSGRAKEMADQLGMLTVFDWDGYVGGSGVSVYDEHMQLIHQNCFSKEQSEAIFSIGHQHAICINSHGQHEFMTLPLNAYAKAAFDTFHCKVPEVRDWQGEDLVAISAYEKADFDWSIFDGIPGIEIQHPSCTCVDIMKTDSNKATGIQKLMNYWGFDPHTYMAFGDSMNDIQMIQEAGIGVVMGNAQEKLKNCGDVVIGPSWEPSIYNYLKDNGYL